MHKLPVFLLFVSFLMAACQPKPYASFLPTTKEHFVGHRQKSVNLPDKMTPVAASKSTQVLLPEVSKPIVAEQLAADLSQSSTSTETTIPEHRLLYRGESPQKEIKKVQNKSEDVATPARKTSAISVISLGLSLASYVLMFGGVATNAGGIILAMILAGFITGIIGLTKTGKNKKKGKGYAIAGLVLSSGLIILIGLVIAYFSSFS